MKVTRKQARVVKKKKKKIELLKQKAELEKELAKTELNKQEEAAAKTIGPTLARLQTKKERLERELKDHPTQPELNKWYREVMEEIEKLR